MPILMRQRGSGRTPPAYGDIDARETRRSAP